MENVIERVVQRLVLAAIGVPVSVQREARDRFGKDPHAGIDGCCLQRRALVDILSGRAAAKEEAVVAAWKVVLDRFVTGFE